MRAAVLFETGQPLEIVEDIGMPSLVRGQVQVKMLYSGLCHSQLMEVSGSRGKDKYLPHLLGHEGVGEVEAVGEGVTKVVPGDRVIISWIKGCGLDAPGGQYHHKGYVINSGSATTLSEKTIVAENRVYLIPHGLPPELAVLFGCALPTGLGLVLNELKPRPSSSIAVYGLGGIGMSALLAAKSTKPQLLIAIDVNDDKLRLAVGFGADIVINASKTDPVTKIHEITGGVGVDYSIEAGGTSRTIEQAFESVRDSGGQCIFASHPAHDDKISLEPHAFHRGKSLRGSWGGGCNMDRDIPRFSRLYAGGSLNIELLISKIYKLDEVNTALRDLEEREIVRGVIQIGP
jgi:S-(hydroxymethyl)glutathione dehydrogenase/alcohol dehydrogenase